MTVTDRQRRYGLRWDALILHCPGPERALTSPVRTQWEATCHSFFSDPTTAGCARDLDELTVVTYNTRPFPGLLERCLTRLGLTQVQVLGKGLPDWRWAYKVLLLHQFLDSGRCRTPRILCLDGDDVLVLEDLKCIINRFVEFGCQMLFCNTGIDWPPSPQCATFERSLGGDPDHCHLNAGGFLASSSFLADRLREIVAAMAADPLWCRTDEGFDDQLAWRQQHLLHYPDIQVDRNCRVFLRFDDRR